MNSITAFNTKGTAPGWGRDYRARVDVNRSTRGRSCGALLDCYIAGSMETVAIPSDGHGLMKSDVAVYKKE